MPLKYLTPAIVFAFLALSASPTLSATPANNLFLGNQSLIRYEIRLAEALPGGRDLTLHLGYQAGEIRQEWATIPGERTVAERVDVSALSVADGWLSGEVDVWIEVDGSMFRGVYDLDLSLSENPIQATYSGHYAVRTREMMFFTDDLMVKPEDVRLFTYGDLIENTLSGFYEAPADPNRPTAFTLHSGHLLLGSLSVTRYITLSFEIDNGEISDVTFGHGRNSASITWSAEILGYDFAYLDDSVSGTITVEISGGSPRTENGTYVISFTGEVGNNEVTGNFTSTLNGAPAGSSFLTGTASGLYEPEDERIYTIELRRGIEGIHRLRMNLRYSNGIIFEGVGMRPDVAQRFPADVSGLTAEGGGLVGTVTVDFSGATILATDQPFSVEYTLSAESSGPREVSGHFSAHFGPVTPVQGPATGKRRTAEELGAAHAFNAALEWPAWNGPFSNMKAARSGSSIELVESLDDASLLWRSEHIPPGRAQTTRYGEGNILRYIERGGAAGGGSSPVVAHGMVYQYYFRPSGDNLVNYPMQEIAAGNRTLGPEMWTLDAEDVVIAIDAATGATVWKTTLPGGRYHGWEGTGIEKGAYTAKTAAGYGRVYVHATNNRTLAFNAHTGELLWIRSTGDRYALARPGMVIFSGRDLRALDADTGATLWEVPNAGSTWASPLHWEHAGTSYILTGNSSGRVVCVKEETGEIQWELSGVGDNAFTMSVGGNLLLLNVGGIAGRPNRLGAYALTSTEATLAWSLDGNFGYNSRSGTIPVIVDNRVYFQTTSSTLLKLDLHTGAILGSVGNAWRDGYTQWFDGRLIVQNDATHSDTPLNLFRADGTTLARLAPQWRPPFRDTSSYTPGLTSHAYADGRLFIRGARGIYALDLRAAPEEPTPPVITLQPVGGTVTAGTNMTLTVGVGGSGPMSFEWRRNGRPLSDGPNLAGSDGPTLTILNTTLLAEGFYEVVAFNSAGEVVSERVHVGVSLPERTAPVLAEWSFNGFASTTTSDGFGETFPADASSGLLYVQSATSTGTNFTRSTSGGTLVNASTGTPAGGSIELRRGQRWNGGIVEARFDATGHTALGLSFAYLTSDSFPSTTFVEWSVDGGHSFTGVATLTNADYRDFTRVFLDLSSIAELDGQSDVRIRLRFSEDGGSATSGMGATIDNVRVKAAPTASGFDQWRNSLFPEPTAPEADPAAETWQNGVANLLVYALGLDHLETPLSGLPRVQGPLLQFTRRTDAEAYIIVETSRTLAPEDWDIIAYFDPANGTWQMDENRISISEDAEGPVHHVTATPLPEESASDTAHFWRVNVRAP